METNRGTNGIGTERDSLGLPRANPAAAEIHDWQSGRNRRWKSIIRVSCDSPLRNQHHRDRGVILERCIILGNETERARPWDTLRTQTRIHSITHDAHRSKRSTKDLRKIYERSTKDCSLDLLVHWITKVELIVATFSVIVLTFGNFYIPTRADLFCCLRSPRGANDFRCSWGFSMFFPFLRVVQGFDTMRRTALLSSSLGFRLSSLCIEHDWTLIALM